jgi:hypothetical protein
MMATIKELYGRANNPDLTHWKDVQLFSIVESALLTSGLDPLDYENIRDESILIEALKTNNHANWRQAVITIKALKQAVCTSEIECKVANIFEENNYDRWVKNVLPIDLGIENIDDVVIHQTKITRKEFQKWLFKNGYLTDTNNSYAILSTGALLIKPKIKHRQSTYADVSTQPMAVLQSPLYTTPALDVVNAVVKEFWVGFDSETMSPPKQDTVVAWIKENYIHISSKQMQEAIDKICRHPSAKTGGIKPLRTIKDVTPLK